MSRPGARAARPREAGALWARQARMALLLWVVLAWAIPANGELDKFTVTMDYNNVPASWWCFSKDGRFFARADAATLRVTVYRAGSSEEADVALWSARLRGTPDDRPARPMLPMIAVLRDGQRIVAFTSGYQLSGGDDVVVDILDRGGGRVGVRLHEVINPVVTLPARDVQAGWSHFSWLEKIVGVSEDKATILNARGQEKTIDLATGRVSDGRPAEGIDTDYRPEYAAYAVDYAVQEGLDFCNDRRQRHKSYRPIPFVCRDTHAPPTAERGIPGQQICRYSPVTRVIITPPDMLTRSLADMQPFDVALHMLDRVFVMHLLPTGPTRGKMVIRRDQRHSIDSLKNRGGQEYLFYDGGLKCGVEEGSAVAKGQEYLFYEGSLKGQPRAKVVAVSYDHHFLDITIETADTIYEVVARLHLGLASSDGGRPAADEMIVYRQADEAVPITELEGGKKR